MNSFIAALFRRLDRPASILGAVFVGAFLETTLLPIPFEVLLVPLMLRYRSRVWLIVSAALAGCMAGAFAGYAVGAFAYDSIGQTVLQWSGAGNAMDAFSERVADNAFWSLFLVGFTPVPVQVATLGAGFMAVSLATFTLAMLVSRGLRYAALGFLVHVFGAGAQRMLRRHRGKALVLALSLVVVLAYLLIGPAQASPTR